jgi:hypothetical protein
MLIIIIIFLFSELAMTQNLDFEQGLYQDYEFYKEKSLSQRRFKHADILPLINSLKNKNIFKVNKVGESAEKRDIYLISTGSGDIKIFLWSQMHGDEATATMALFDIFNFLSSDDRFNNFRTYLLEKVTLYFMPMVNPDGAEVFQRRNIFEIDINRDAVRQQTPEGQILKNTFDSLKAKFGFNLHDQSIYYSAGNSFKSATLSFLAPTTNYEKLVNPVREDAMRLIANMYKTMSHFIPGHIAKYSDEFEPRAFGDNFQKWGTSTILIESGGWKDDPEKQFIRKLNFIALLSAFKSIADETYKKEKLEGYEKIPFNEEMIMDLLLKNLLFKQNGHEYLIDIGINREEINCNESNDFYYESNVEDLGDLSVFYGYEEHDLRGMEVIPGKTYPEKFNSIDEVGKLNFAELFNKGYTTVFLNNSDDKLSFTKLPINITVNEKYKDKQDIDVEDSPNFIIKKNGIVKYVVINGFLVDPANMNFTGNGFVFK